MPQLLPLPTSFSASANTALIEALWLLEERLASWSSNQDAFNDLLQQVFGVQSSTNTADLQATISDSGLGINLEILDATSIDGLIAAYTSASPDGRERIYINGDWLELAAPEKIEAVLLEELSHAIDHRLNGSNDSTGRNTSVGSYCCELRAGGCVEFGGSGFYGNALAVDDEDVLVVLLDGGRIWGLIAQQG